MSKDGERLHNLFLEASELTGEERRQWLDEHCADDPALRRKLESLLRQDDAGGTLPRLHELVQPVLREAGSTFGDDLGSSTVPVALPTSLIEDPLLANVPVQNGAKVLRQFVLVERLGAGGMGAVYRATHQRLRVERAIKCLLPTAGRAESLQRFEREARVAAQVEHEHLVQVYDIDHAHGLHYIVMEYIAGRTLTGWVREEGPIPPRRACEVILAAARGLSMAHQRGIVHRDIKPGNIMLRDDGLVKVVDLGLAKAAEGVDSLMTRSHAFMGTPQYMPPEQYDGAAAAGAPADVYGLAATLSFLLTGRDPFAGLSSSQIMRILFRTGFPQESLGLDGLPDAVRGVIVKATSAEPEKRHPDAGALATDLETCLGVFGEEAGMAAPGAGRSAAVPLEIARDKAFLTHQPLSPKAAAPAAKSKQPTDEAVESAGSDAPATHEEPPRVGGLEAPSARNTRAGITSTVLLLALMAVAVVWDPWGWLSEGPSDASGEQTASTAGDALGGESEGSAVGPKMGDDQAAPSVAELPPRTPPTVDLLEPVLSDGRMVVAGGQLSIRGRVVAESPGVLELLLDGQAVAETEFHAADSEDGQVVVFENFPFSARGAEVEARLRAQQDDVLVWTVVIDADPPDLTIDSQAVGDGWTTADSFTLVGKVRDPHLGSVVVRTGDDHLDAAVTRGGDWRAEVRLPADGAHEVTVEARDMASNVATVDIVLQRDSVLPELSIDTDALGDGWTAADAFTLTGSVSDPHLASVVVRSGDERLEAAVKGNGEWTAEVRLRTDGDYLIDVEAADIAGNLATAGAILRRDTTPPVLRPLDVPAQVVTDTVDLVFDVQDASTVVLTVEGLAASQQVDGRWSVTVPLPTPGWHVLVAKASDRLDHMTRRELEIERLPPAPQDAPGLPWFQGRLVSRSFEPGEVGSSPYVAIVAPRPEFGSPDAFVDALHEAAADTACKAVVLWLDGSVDMAASLDAAWDQIDALREAKPAIAYLSAELGEDQYGLAAACDAIVADESCALRVGQLRRPGVTLSRIAEGRGLAPARIQGLAMQDVVSGGQAEQAGLADILGNVVDSVRLATVMGGVDAGDVAVELWPADASQIIDPHGAQVGELGMVTAPSAAYWAAGDRAPSVAGLIYVGENEQGYPEYDKKLPGDVPLRLVLVPAGSFVMGSPENEEGRFDDEGPQRIVTLDAFLMAKNECTIWEWMAAFSEEESNGLLGRIGSAAENAPLENVPWDVIQVFEQLTGLSLPSEAQWEYAARAGTTEPRHGDLDEIAWHAGNADGDAHSVRTRQANAFGLHDMIGNVWEWCEDTWHDTYSGAPADGSAWVDHDGLMRVLRGGDTNCDPVSLRSAHRAASEPARRYLGVGFRPMLSLVGGSWTRVERAWAAAGAAADGGNSVPAPPDLSMDNGVAGLTETTDAAAWTLGDPAPAIEGLTYFGENEHGYPEYEQMLPGDVPLRLVLVPAGSFRMGGNAPQTWEREHFDDEYPSHTVTLDAFLIARTECTQRQWQAVMGSNPSRFIAAGLDAPVEQVSWDDVQDFEALTGLALPSEAQWEYAARAGWPWYRAKPYFQLSEFGWYRDNSGSKTHIVQSKLANAFGLYDLLGNVAEWCEDTQHDTYKDAPVDGAAWVDTGSAYRVVRGGSWSSAEVHCRLSYRDYWLPGARGGDLGFRPARSLP